MWEPFRSAPLDPAQSRALAALRHDGIAVTHLDEFFGPDVAREVLSYARRLYTDTNVDAELRHAEAAGRDAWHGKEMSRFILGDRGEKPVLTLANPLMRLMLDERVLAVGASYLGMALKLLDFNIGVSALTPKEWPVQNSQRWHRDEGDRRFFKVFIYLSDVPTAEAGALVFARQSQYGARWGRVFPNKPWVPGLLNDSDVATGIPREQILACTGRPGTLVFADTSALHNNGRSTSSRRMLALVTYNSLVSLRDRNYCVPQGGLEGLGPLATYAILK
jgi:hypothetical protein